MQYVRAIGKKFEYLRLCLCAGGHDLRLHAVSLQGTPGSFKRRIVCENAKFVCNLCHDCNTVALFCWAVMCFDDVLLTKEKSRPKNYYRYVQGAGEKLVDLWNPGSKGLLGIGSPSDTISCLSGRFNEQLL